MKYLILALGSLALISSNAKTISETTQDSRFVDFNNPRLEKHCRYLSRACRIDKDKAACAEYKARC